MTKPRCWPACWSAKAITAAHSGVAALVPWAGYRPPPLNTTAMAVGVAAAPRAAAAMNPNSAIMLVSWENRAGLPARPKLCGSTA